MVLVAPAKHAAVARRQTAAVEIIDVTGDPPPVAPALVSGVLPLGQFTDTVLLLVQVSMSVDVVGTI